jgi:hypothetical protein
VRVRGWRAVVKDVGIRPPNDGQAAADDARPRPRHYQRITSHPSPQRMSFFEVNALSWRALSIQSKVWLHCCSI